MSKVRACLSGVPHSVALMRYYPKLQILDYDLKTDSLEYAQVLYQSKKIHLQTR